MSLTSPIQINDPIFNLNYPHIKESLSKDNVIESCLQIISSILDYYNESSIKNNNSKFDGEVPEIESMIKVSSKESLETDDSTNKSFSESNEYLLEDLEIYIRKWSKYFEFDKNMLILFLMNFDKLLAKDFIVNKKNIYKVIYICMMETHKYYDDNIFKNKDYAKFIGVNENELMDMEIEFLTIIDYDLFIKEEEFQGYQKKLIDLFNNNC